MRTAKLSLAGTLTLPDYSDAGFAIDPAGQYVYVGSGNSILQVSTALISIVQTIPVTEPLSLAVAGSAAELYILRNAGGLAVFNEGKTQEEYVFGARFPSWLTVSPDGSLLYSADEDLGGIEVFSTSSGALQQTLLPFPDFIASLAVSPDGSVVYAVGEEDIFEGPAYLWVVNAATGAIAAQIPMSGSALALTPDGSTLLIATSSGVMVFDTKTLQVTATVPSDGGTAIAIEPSGSVAFVQMALKDGVSSVAVLNLANLEIVTSIAVAGEAIAFSPTQPVAYISDGVQSISIISTDTYQIIGSIPLVTGSGEALAVTPDGRYLYAVAPLSNGFTTPPLGAFIDTSTLAQTPLPATAAVAIH